MGSFAHGGDFTRNPLSSGRCLRPAGRTPDRTRRQPGRAADHSGRGGRELVRSGYSRRAGQ